MVVLHPLLLYSENMVRFFGWPLSRPVSAGWYERSNPDLAARSIYPKKNQQYVLFPVWLRQMLPGSPNKNRPHLLPAMLPIVPYGNQKTSTITFYRLESERNTSSISS